MPREDRAFAMIRLTAPDGASLEYTLDYIKEAEQIVLKDVERGDALRALGRSGSWGAGSDVNTGMVISPLQVWSKRERSANDIVQGWNQQLAQLPGVQAFAFAPGCLEPWSEQSTAAVSCLAAQTTKNSQSGATSSFVKLRRFRACPISSQTTRNANPRSTCNRSRPGCRARRVAVQRRPNAGNHSRLQSRDDVHRARRGIPRHLAGPRRRAPDSKRPGKHLRQIRAFRTVDTAIKPRPA